MVYELPGVPPDQAHQFSDHLIKTFPQAEIIDGGATDDAALREKIKGPFVLFTVLDKQARLWRLAAQSLPLKLEDGILRWDDFAGPAKDLRITFMGRNPYGSGYAMVLAWGSMPIQGGENQDYSYAIHNATGLVRTGTYDEHFVPTDHRRPKLTAEQWRADVAFLASELPHRHKNAFHQISKAEFERRVKELDAAIPRMSESEIRAGIAQLVAAVGDGHTQAGFASDRLLDLSFQDFPEGLFIVGAPKDHADVIGARVISVDGTPAGELRKRLSPFIAEENEFSSQAYVSLMRHAAALQVSGIIHSQESAEFVLQQDGRPLTLSLRARLTSEPPPDLAPAPMTQPLYLKDRHANYWYEYLSDSKTLYINYNSCAEMASLPFQRFAQEVVEQAAKEAPEKVVIDLRRNGGGSSSVWRPLLEALHKNPALRPRGELYGLISRGTFSSGLLNAIQLRRDFHALLAGEPTVEKPNHYGEMRAFSLPNSAIAVHYSTKYFPELKDDPPALMPDLRIPLTAADYFAGRDPVLEAILKRLNHK